MTPERIAIKITVEMENVDYSLYTLTKTDKITMPRMY